MTTTHRGVFWLVSSTIKLLINACEDFRVTLRLNVLKLFPWTNIGLNKQPEPKLIIWLWVQEYVVLCENAVLGLKVVQISGETQFALTNHLWVGAVLAGVGEHALHENTTAKFKKYYLRIKVILRTLQLWTGGRLFAAFLISWAAIQQLSISFFNSVFFPLTKSVTSGHILTWMPP